MPRPRVYRHDVRCPECRRYHIPEASCHRPSAADGERVLAMYKEGSSLSAAARVFGASAHAVSQWVEKEGARRCPGCGGGGNSVAKASLAASRQR